MINKLVNHVNDDIFTVLGAMLLVQIAFVCLVMIVGEVSLRRSRRINLRTVVEANQDFAVRLYEEVTAAGDTGNVFFSPHSVSAALAMTYSGAARNTKMEMKKTLGFGYNDNGVTYGFNQLSRELFDSDNVNTLMEANRLFGQEGYRFLRRFTNRLNNDFDAGFEMVNFLDKETTIDIINDYVAEQTNNNIVDMLSVNDINADTQMILANALYFKGVWQKQFNPDETRSSSFYLADGGNVQVPYMRATDTYKYHHSDVLRCKMITLPYSNEEATMSLLLPDYRVSLEDMEASFGDGALLQELDQLSNRNIEEVVVQIPKFNTTYSTHMKDMLRDMGMREAFTQDADFSRMDGTERLYLGDVIHQAAVEVSEEGTEAAAATIVRMDVRSGGFVTSFVANKPFMFLIQHGRTEEILFMGRIANPTV